MVARKNGLLKNVSDDANF